MRGVKNLRKHSGGHWGRVSPKHLGADVHIVVVTEMNVEAPLPFEAAPQSLSQCKSDDPIQITAAHVRPICNPTTTRQCLACELGMRGLSPIRVHLEICYSQLSYVRSLQETADRQRIGRFYSEILRMGDDLPAIGSANIANASPLVARVSGNRSAGSYFVTLNPTTSVTNCFESYLAHFLVSARPLLKKGALPSGQYAVIFIRLDDLVTKAVLNDLVAHALKSHKAHFDRLHPVEEPTTRRQTRRHRPEPKSAAHFQAPLEADLSEQTSRSDICSHLDRKPRW
jgi:hypothetical protein